MNTIPESVRISPYDCGLGAVSGDCRGLSSRAAWPIIVLTLLLAAAEGLSQSTQGLITGRVLNSRTGVPVTTARVSYSISAKGITGTGRVNADGYYYLPLLSPGLYNIRVEAEEFQSQELDDVLLLVAGRLELDFLLRPVKDVWERGESRSLVAPGSRTVVTFFGPDVDAGFLTTMRTSVGTLGALETSVSQVVDSTQLMELPLAGRDVYTMLVTQPGVSVDTTTARSLGLSSNGQRPSASNFLLDGVENNNLLVSGPLTPVAPEMVQEYRISTNNFSAEFGRASGFIANAITRGGINEWHGLAYLYSRNEHLNANDFQSNLAGQPRVPVREYQPGLTIGGPLLRNRIFLFSAYEHLRSRSAQARSCLAIPSDTFLTGSVNPVTRDLLLRFPVDTAIANAPACQSGIPAADNVMQRLAARPVSVDRNVMTHRVDAPLRGGQHRLVGRYALSRVARPDYLWSPYRDFVSSLDDNTDSVAASLSSQLSPQWSNEFRVGGARQRLGFDRAHPEVPYLASLDGVQLPGSPATATIDYDGRSWEFQDNVMRLRGRHIMTAGGGILFRAVDGSLTASRDGEYYFPNVQQFAAANPIFVRFTMDRAMLPLIRPAPFERTYKYRQYYFFAQDTFRFNRRVAVNYGIRYDYLGHPVNTGEINDAIIEPGPGNTLAERLAAGTIAVPSDGDQELFRADRNNWAPRVGISIDPTGSGRTLIRGAWGVFHDRPFENIWTNLRNNRFLLPRALEPVRGVSYMTPINEVMPLYEGREISSRFPVLTYIRPDLRAAWAHSYFAGVQRRFTGSLVVEINALGSAGRDLISTDMLNRQATDNQGFTPYPALGRISFRANDGYSDYHGATASARWQAGSSFFHASYTWSHAIDNQSEVLRNDYFDLNPVRLTGQSSRIDTSAFTIEGDRNIDRGNADFDQRHNFVFVGSLEIPQLRGDSLWSKLSRNWRVSQMGAFRAGTPFTVFAGSASDPAIVNNRAILVDPAAARVSVDIPGGRQILSPAAFRNPGPAEVGNSGRNAFRSPGFWNVDISVARSFGIAPLGEATRVTVRADIFNVFNHANLNAPENRLGPGFGVARFGRNSPPSGLPSLAPLNEAARQIQLMLRIQF